MGINRFLFACFICFAAAASIGQITQPSDDQPSDAPPRRPPPMYQIFRDGSHVPDPAAGYRWRDAAKAASWGQADIDAIAKSKFRFSGAELRQVFDPYVRGEYPPFITSDSVLNAYNVLFEESIRQLESANARKLLPILRKTFDRLATADGGITGKPEMVAAAKLRAQVTIAVAVTLLGDDTLKLDATLAPIVAAEVKRVHEATGLGMPAWLGKPDADFLGLDYARFTPRGFYTRSPLLENYFRAVAWLQAIPFRIDRDMEFVSALLIGKAAMDKDAQEGGNAFEGEDKEPLNALFSVYDHMLGEPDDPDLKSIRHFASGGVQMDLTTDDLTRTRDQLLSMLKDDDRLPKISDTLRFEQHPSVSIRVLSARRTPDAILFQRIMDSPMAPALPTGLDVAAALGSQYAVALLPRPLPGGEPLGDAKTIGHGSLYCDYLNCLQALADKPEKDAPPIFSSAAWQAKSCQTILGGWAQIRHTWQLQAKENEAVFGGAGPHPAGFVEPIPEFYSRMAALCDRSAEYLHEAGADGPDFPMLSSEAHALIDLLEKTDLGRDGKPTPHKLTDDEQSSSEEMLSASDPTGKVGEDAIR